MTAASETDQVFAALLAAQQEKLSGYADEVKAGRIVRGEDHS